MPAMRPTVLQKQADGRAIAGTLVLLADADVLAGIGGRILIKDMADLMGQGKGTLVDRLPVWIVQYETLLGIRLRGPVMRPFAAGYDCNTVVPAVGQQPVDYFVHRHHSLPQWLLVVILVVFDLRVQVGFQDGLHRSALGIRDLDAAVAVHLINQVVNALGFFRFGVTGTRLPRIESFFFIGNAHQPAFVNV